MKPALAVSISVLSAGCIIPDRDIRIDAGIDNENPVRILERSPRAAEMEELCNPADPKKDPPQVEFCPEVRRSRPSGLVQSHEGPFCVCPGDENDAIRDRRAVPIFEIYAEDADVEGEAAKDTIYAVALLDPDPGSTFPQAFAAYENYWRPCAAGEHVGWGDDKAGDITFPPVGRETTRISVFRLDDGRTIDVDGEPQGRVDLCNNNNGLPLAPGVHHLQFMVTDRPFFVPAEMVNGEPTGHLGHPRCGEPDLAAGATYDVTDFVFECLDSAVVDAPDCVQNPLTPEQVKCECDCIAS